MNYEEKYKQALETVQEILSSGADAIRIKRLKLRLQSVFPELAESEDERIRKEIISALKNANYKGVYDKHLAWLEKQKNTSDKEYVFRPLAGDTIEKAAERAVKLDGKVVLAFNGTYIPVGNKTKDEIVAEYHNSIKKQCGRVKLPDSSYTTDKSVIEFADEYSHNVWEKLMANFNNIDGYSIGCNDVSDIVLNAIIDACNWNKTMTRKEKDLEDLFQALPEKIVDEKSHQVYELCVYHDDGQFVVDYVGELDHDSLHGFSGDTLYDAIEKAWNWLCKNSAGGDKDLLKIIGYDYTRKRTVHRR